MAVVSISLPDALLARADRLIESGGFSGRSELLRACVRDFLVAHAEADAKGLRQATVTLVYPHGLVRHFTRIRHDFSDVVKSMMHGHAGDACVEVFVLAGDAARVRGFANALRGTKDALQVALVFTDAWDEARQDAPAAEEPKRLRGRKPGARHAH